MENKKILISQELFTIAELAIKIRELELLVNNCLDQSNLEDRLLILRDLHDLYRYNFYIDEHYIGCVYTTEEIEIDAELNKESENPVQNKVITIKLLELELELGEFEDNIVERLAAYLNDIQLEFDNAISLIRASLSKYLTTELFRTELTNALKGYLTRDNLVNYATKDYVAELLNKIQKFTLDTVVKHGSRNPVENEAIASAIDESLLAAKKYTDSELAKFVPSTPDDPDDPIIFDYKVKDLYDTATSLMIKMNEEGEVLFKGIKVGDLPTLSLFGSGVISIPVGGNTTIRLDSSALLQIHPNVSTIYFDPNSHNTNEAVTTTHDIELLYGNNGTLPIKNVRVSITGKKDDYHSSIDGVSFARNLDGDYLSFTFRVSANASYNLVYDNIFLYAESVDPNGATIGAYATLQITKNLGGNPGKDACIILSDPAIINITADYDLQSELFLCKTNLYHFQLRMVKGSEEITNWISSLEFDDGESFTEANPGGVNNIYYNNAKNIALGKTGNAVVLYLGYKFENNFIISNKTKLSQVPSYIRIKGVAGNDVGYGNISLNVNGMGLPGAAGARGPLAVFYGMWQGNNPSTDTVYKYTDDEVPIVCVSEGDDDRYFVLKDNEKSREGLSNRKNTDLFRKSPAICSDMWTESANYDFVWAKIILANYGKLGKAVFWGDFMFSEMGTTSLDSNISYSAVSNKDNIFIETSSGTSINTSVWEPHFYVNLRTGKLVGNNTTIRGHVEAISGKIGNFIISENGIYNDNLHVGDLSGLVKDSTIANIKDEVFDVHIDSANILAEGKLENATMYFRNNPSDVYISYKVTIDSQYQENYITPYFINIVNLLNLNHSSMPGVTIEKVNISYSKDGQEWTSVSAGTTSFISDGVYTFRMRYRFINPPINLPLYIVTSGSTLYELLLGGFKGNKGVYLSKDGFVFNGDYGDSAITEEKISFANNNYKVALGPEGIMLVNQLNDFGIGIYYSNISIKLPRKEWKNLYIDDSGYLKLV